MGKEGKISSSRVTIFGMDLSTCPVAHPICSIEPLQGAHCTVCGKDLPLITSPRPRAVREPTALDYVVESSEVTIGITRIGGEAGNWRWSYLPDVLVSVSRGGDEVRRR